ncbi:DoxX family protein [Flavobacteriaceae bacterium]|jgi:hypothetical protein|nr:DoxX family protein [Flavobacteriaceae bacterium]MDB4256029.1 DoxX family protein [Flavobacteriaceae bacterium]MDC0001311.1 DoxX family protein [Flavobacteriaceae bacterium]MDC1392808.1 DoxX family protein [Flavobacteriaceae bacterium]|tara:strand:- start:1384 stop:1764 length:381 start_codon:yes stop_codon:yes gene_type:complete
MKILKYLLMSTISLIVLNVWFFRFNTFTIYRGGNATNMIEEFAVYGFSETVVYIIGGLKILAAFGLLFGFFFEKTILPSVSLMGTLMLGAIIMHFKINDEAIKFLPAGLLFISSLTVLYLHKKERS